MRGGQAMLKVMQRSGIDYILSSPGSEWPPVWEALAEQTAQGIKKPGYVNCRHEAVAVAMAAGYTKVTGRPQVVMLHATAGPLNAAMTLRAALQERTPMVIISGEIAAYGENTRVADPGGQWLHDLTDLGGSPDLLRGCVKWADRVMSAELLGPTIERAVQIALEPPAGPVLIGIPFECMMEEVVLPEHGRANEVIRPVAVGDDAIDKALEWITAAKNPIAVTEHAGGDPRAVARLVELCELFGIPVMETYRPAFMNFPRTHPLYQHHDAKAVDAADLVLMVDAVTPWYPASKGPKNGKVVSIAEEFPNSRLPYWGYNVDLALAAPPAATLEKLVKKAKSSERVAANRGAYEQRASQHRERHESYFGKLKEEARKHAHDTPIDPRWLCNVLGEAIPENAVISEETTVYRGLIQEAIPRSQTQSYFARITGGLGVGLSYALGVKLAMPDKPVFALIGDGAFHYNAVPSCLGVAEEYGLPIHVVVFNNGRYLSMETSLIKYFPDGSAKNTGVHYGAEIGPRPDYQHYAKAHGGYGYRVTQPDEIKSAVEQALKHETEKKLTVIDVVLSDLNPR
ncbi:MAG TPA: thiamine pyrophosphate-binding protein [Terriglobales bacterium]|nr:thiamine pyrophosphate-binding protein [Terriglobales bacterium]